MTPPAVSIPRDRGVTSSRSRSWTFSDLSPERMAAWTAKDKANGLEFATEPNKVRI